MMTPYRATPIPAWVAAAVAAVSLLLGAACTGSAQPDGSDTELDPRKVASLTQVCRVLEEYASERRPRERRLLVRKILRRYPEYGSYEARGPARELARKRVTLDVSLRFQQLSEAGLPSTQQERLIDKCGGFIRRNL